MLSGVGCLVICWALFLCEVCLLVVVAGCGLLSVCCLRLVLWFGGLVVLA